MNILALDPARITGFAHTNGVGGVIEFSHGDARLRELEDWLTDKLDEWPTELIAFEDAGFGSHNPHVQALHNENRGVIKLIATRRRIAVRACNIKSIKKFATGNGNAKKEQMIAAAERHFKIKVTNDNFADALWILEFAKQPQQPTVTKERKKKSAKKQPKLF